MLSISGLVVNKINWENGLFSYYLAMLSMIVLPLYPNYVPPLMLGWGLSVLIEFVLFKRNPFLLNGKRKGLLILFVAYFLLLCSGILYSSDIENEKLLLFRRLSLLIFPFILLSPGRKIIDNRWVLFRLFVISTIIYIIVCHLYATYRSLSIVDGRLIFSFRPPIDSAASYYMGGYFTQFQHPSYTAMNVILSAFLAFDTFLDKSLKIQHRIMWILSGLFLLLSLYFLSSRAAFLVILFTVPIYLILILRRKRINMFLLAALATGIIAIGFIFLNNRKVQIVLNGTENTTLQQRISTDVRLSYWHSSVEVIKDHPLLGVGLGDSSAELQKEFKQLGYSEGFYNNLNSHNQFLEAGISSGILGILVIVSIVGYMLYISITTRNRIYFLFTLMMILCFMFESVLNRMAGLYFFSIFCFLLIIPESKSE